MRFCVLLQKQNKWDKPSKLAAVCEFKDYSWIFYVETIGIFDCFSIFFVI